MLDHLGMPAQIGDEYCSRRVPSDRHICAGCRRRAPDLSRPVLMVPRSAHRRNVFEPRQLTVELRQFFSVSELPRTAGSIQQEEWCEPSKRPFFPFPRERPNVADEGSHSSDRRNQKMIFSPVLRVEAQIFLSEPSASAGDHRAEACAGRESKRLREQAQKRIRSRPQRVRMRSSTGARCVCHLVRPPASRTVREQSRIWHRCGRGTSKDRGRNLPAA